MLLLQVQIGVSDFMFKLLILGGFSDVYGRLWLRHSSHIYIIEFTNSRNSENVDGEYRQVVSVCLDVFSLFLNLTTKKRMKTIGVKYATIYGEVQICLSMAGNDFSFIKIF